MKECAFGMLKRVFGKKLGAFNTKETREKRGTQRGLTRAIYPTRA